MASSDTTIPHLRSIEKGKQLVVHGKPSLVLSGQLQNSSLTASEYLNTVWQKLVGSHVNTVLECVTWEEIEPIEGQFSFAKLEEAILEARKDGLHLVLLWCGSFKNGISDATPSWIQKDPKRFPHAKLREVGGALIASDALSLFHGKAPACDARAFAHLMRHLKKAENEPGLLGDSRDRSDAAEERFAQPVPEALLPFLTSDWDQLNVDIQRNLGHFKSQLQPQPRGSAGKKEYPLPLYTNVRLNYVGKSGDSESGSVAGG
ncbi:putative beta-galactosidase [Aspergillus homomorphus CBS 101889]|uniref:Glycoside hydrolase family 42 N-terminal domain-containing protein n=1 Tax=Aspergillus homomorphus (strain CBS 101889) TaxID=1450537 RepID=A0A395HL57_ASPHC|nr:hypothetical protein BO97DRAFT_428475 [Aspergillus homomorphus CBS 101889]RAL08336.1 hypothetical protein BO97DRAFT_428475 [Aspergillus homomorphus CBS 101889]